jgi:hypothetical protein
LGGQEQRVEERRRARGERRIVHTPGKQLTPAVAAAAAQKAGRAGKEEEEEEEREEGGRARVTDRSGRRKQ